MESMHLIGSEEVARGGRAVREGAAEMQRAVSSLESVLHQHRIWLDEWLARFESALASDRDAGEVENGGA